MNFKRVLSLFVLAAAGLFAQVNTLVQTSLSSAITATQTSITIASLTGITASLSSSTVIYVDREAMLVTAVPAAATSPITVVRGQYGTKASGHINASMVLAGRPDWFYTTDPSSMASVAMGTTGNCTTASTYTTPYVNILTGNQWLCSTVTLSWVPGFNNSLVVPGVTAAVASAAGQITPSGPLFHITGTAAITGFLYPIGLAAGQPSGEFCAIPDAIFTTTATNNIALASTAVVNKLLCWIWDYTNLKWVPTY